MFYSSCATVLRGTNCNNSIAVSGYPQKANVYLNDTLVGSTPLSFKIKKRNHDKKNSNKSNYGGFSLWKLYITNIIHKFLIPLLLEQILPIY